MNHNSTLLALVILILFFDTSCRSKHGFGGAASIGADSINIVPFVGIGNVVLGKSNIEDVEKVFGKGKRHREWHSPTDIDPGQLVRIVKYPNLGIEFKGYHPSLFSEYTIGEIELTDSCKYRTKMGIGIGSTLNDLRREFGPVQVIHMHAWEGEWVEAYVLQENVSMRFICYNTDTTQYKVERIVMR